MRRLIPVLTIVLVCMTAAFLGWIAWELRTPFYHAPVRETYVDIPRGVAPSTIASILQEAGILHSRIPFLLYLRWHDAARRLQAGEYRFSSPATPEQVAQRLIRGDVFFISITIPEGLTARETIEHIAAAGLGRRDDMEKALNQTIWIRSLDPGARSLEGYLFPNTYRFPRRATSDEIVKTMVDHFKLRFARLTETHPIPPNWSTAQIVILASMVEKEVKIPSERPLVASVLANRLERGMPLACDPTIIYALKIAGRYDGNIHKADLAIDSPYNTYIHTGFPAGPIANPGEDSLKASLAPPKTDYLYFVSRNDGTHQFSTNFQAHSLAVERYQKHIAIQRSHPPKTPPR